MGEGYISEGGNSDGACHAVLILGSGNNYLGKLASGDVSVKTEGAVGIAVHNLHTAYKTYECIVLCA